MLDDSEIYVKIKKDPIRTFTKNVRKLLK